MKNMFMAFLTMTGLFVSQRLPAQDSLTVSPWNHTIALNFYFFQDPFILLPTYEVNKGHLHMGIRYNYEDLRTFSFWGGYNFMGGNKLEYVITPMAGIILGNTDGLAGGMQIQLDYKRLSFYSESEYVVDVRDHRNDFFYNWTDITYTITDWLDAGISVQRTRLYQSDVEIQSGLLLGTSLMGIDFTTYFYNPFADDPFLILTLAREF